MKKFPLAVFMIMVSIISTTAVSWSQDLVCNMVNDIDWCYNPKQCGQACNDVCATDGRKPIADNNTWFEAQNTEDECIAISMAFDLGFDTNFDAGELTCLEDLSSDQPAGSTLNPPLQCSTDPSCPRLHRTMMDQQGLECDEIGSHRSICPCEVRDPSLPLPSPVPTLSEWGFIAMTVMLGLISFMVIRRRKASA